MSRELTPADLAPALPENLTEETIRDWGKKLIRHWGIYVVDNNLRGKFEIGDNRWSRVGASDPDQIIDAIFSMIQVTLLGYASNPAEAESKQKQIDAMLRIRNHNPTQGEM